jgi:hypothetical protein
MLELGCKRKVSPGPVPVGWVRVGMRRKGRMNRVRIKIKTKEGVEMESQYLTSVFVFFSRSKFLREKVMSKLTSTTIRLISLVCCFRIDPRFSAWLMADDRSAPNRIARPNKPFESGEKRR